MAGKNTETVGARLPKGYREKISSIARYKRITLGRLFKNFIDDLESGRLVIDGERVTGDVPAANRENKFDYEYLCVDKFLYMLERKGYPSFAIREIFIRQIEQGVPNYEEEN